MEDKKILKLTDTDGNIIEYEILLTFPWNNKNYLVYTDNTYDNNGSLNIQASIYVSENQLVPIETDEEWDEIDKRLKELQ